MANRQISLQKADKPRLGGAGATFPARPRGRAGRAGGDPRRNACRTSRAAPARRPGRRTRSASRCRGRSPTWSIWLALRVRGGAEEHEVGRLEVGEVDPLARGAPRAPSAAAVRPTQRVRRARGARRRTASLKTRQTNPEQSKPGSAFSSSPPQTYGITDQRDGGLEDLLLERRERRDREPGRDRLDVLHAAAGVGVCDRARRRGRRHGVAVVAPSASTRAAENAASARVAAWSGCSSRLSSARPGGRARRPSSRATTSVPKRDGGSSPALRATAANCAATGPSPSASTSAASSRAIETGAAGASAGCTPCGRGARRPCLRACRRSAGRRVGTSPGVPGKMPWLVTSCDRARRPGLVRVRQPTQARRRASAIAQAAAASTTHPPLTSAQAPPGLRMEPDLGQVGNEPFAVHQIAGLVRGSGRSAG